MGLIVDYHLLGRKRKNVYIKITEVNISNRDERTARVLFVTYLSESDRKSDFGNHTGTRYDRTYAHDPEEKDPGEIFFTEVLIKKNGLYGEAYRFLKSCEGFEGAQDSST